MRKKNRYLWPSLAVAAGAFGVVGSSQPWLAEGVIRGLSLLYADAKMITLWVSIAAVVWGIICLSTGRSGGIFNVLLGVGMGWYPARILIAMNPFDGKSDPLWVVRMMGTGLILISVGAVLLVFVGFAGMGQGSGEEREAMDP